MKVSWNVANVLSTFGTRRRSKLLFTERIRKGPDALQNSKGLFCMYKIQMHAALVYDGKLLHIDLEGDGFPLLESTEKKVQQEKCLACRA